jgi:hypothetical protein
LVIGEMRQAGRVDDPPHWSVARLRCLSFDPRGDAAGLVCPSQN